MAALSSLQISYKEIALTPPTPQLQLDKPAPHYAYAVVSERYERAEDKSDQWFTDHPEEESKRAELLVSVCSQFFEHEPCRLGYEERQLPQLAERLALLSDAFANKSIALIALSYLKVMVPATNDEIAQFGREILVNVALQSEDAIRLKYTRGELVKEAEKISRLEATLSLTIHLESRLVMDHARPIDFYNGFIQMIDPKSKELGSYIVVKEMPLNQRIFYQRLIWRLRVQQPTTYAELVAIAWRDCDKPERSEELSALVNQVSFISNRMIGADETLVRYYINNLGEDPLDRKATPVTPLNVAYQSGDLSEVALLLRAGANPDRFWSANSLPSTTSISELSEQERCEIDALIIKAGLSPSSCGSWNDTFLHHLVADANTLSSLRLAVASGFQVNPMKPPCTTLLMVALETACRIPSRIDEILHIVQFLLEQGVRVNEVDLRQLTVLDHIHYRMAMSKTTAVCEIALLRMDKLLVSAVALPSS